MSEIKKIFIEYGLDFDNNRYGFGRSAEIEYDDGAETRTSEKIRISNIASIYFRIWIGKSVFSIDSDGPRFTYRKKSRRNFKIVCGVCGR